MPGVTVRIVWGVLALAGIGGALDGCGGSLGGVPTGTGGQPDPTGIAGTTGVAGRGGRGGPAGRGGAPDAGSSGVFGEPACLTTVTKGASCGPADQQFCYKTCGPSRSGVKSETCLNGVYAEMSGCTFEPTRDYSCYQLPTVVNAACLANGVSEVPFAGSSCDVPSCIVCNSLGGVAGGTYTDSSGAPRVGYCVCQPPDANGNKTWSCASDTSWPCPFGAGCVTTAGTGGVGGTGGGVAGTGGDITGTGGGSFGQPACPSTVVRGGACTAVDPQFCYKTCGPDSVGVKTETCTTNGTYAEMSGCTFDPSRDFSCYKIPSTTNAVCPQAVTPQASGACDVPPCTLCNSLQGIVGGQYLDSSGAPKVGWCACKLPNAAGTRTWSCASDTSWPCPLGSGC